MCLCGIWGTWDYNGVIDGEVFGKEKVQIPR